jgi:hypothetical protein
MSRKNSFREDTIKTGGLDEGSNHSTRSKRGKRKSDSLSDEQQPTAEIRFPWKLHRILDDADAKGFSDIVSWVPSENGFKVHKTKDFDEEIMPKYFDKTKYKSFQRQLNMWGFDRVGFGTFKGAYLHPHFIRGKPEQCHFMERTKIKGIHSKKLRKSLNQDPLGGGSNHSHGSASNHSHGSASNHSVSNQSLGEGSDHNYLGGGSFHSSPSVVSSSNNVSNAHASIEAAREANAQKRADLERQKEEVQRKLAMVMTSSSSSSSRMVTPHSSLHSRNEQESNEDDCFQPLPLDEGDSLLFGGRNFFFVEDGKTVERPWSHQPQGKRAGRRYSLELKAPDSDEYVLKQLDDKYFGGDIGDGAGSSINISRINAAEQIMLPTPLPPNLNAVTAGTTDIANRNNSSLIIGLDKPMRRFSFLSTPVENPFDKPYPLKPPRTSSVSRESMNMLDTNNNMMTVKMKMNMYMMTNHLSNMHMNLNMNNSDNNVSLNNLIRMSRQNLS